MNDNIIVELADLEMIDVNEAKFAPEKGGYLSLTYKGTEYGKVKLNRALPYRAPDEYICVSDKDFRKNRKKSFQTSLTSFITARLSPVSFPQKTGWVLCILRSKQLPESVSLP